MIFFIARQEPLHEYLGSKFELIFILSKVSILIRICKKNQNIGDKIWNFVTQLGLKLKKVVKKNT